MVFDHPFFAVTGADGAFEIKGVPAGEQNLVLWQERVGYVGFTDPARKAQGRAVTIRAGEVTDVGCGRDRSVAGEVARSRRRTTMLRVQDWPLAPGAGHDHPPVRNRLGTGGQGRPGSVDAHCRGWNILILRGLRHSEPVMRRTGDHVRPHSSEAKLVQARWGSTACGVAGPVFFWSARKIVGPVGAKHRLNRGQGAQSRGKWNDGEISS